MKIKLVFHGYLKKHNHNLPEKDIIVEDGTSVAQLIDQTSIPKAAIAFAAANGSRVSKSYVLQEGDIIKLFQLVGGG